MASTGDDCYYFYYASCLKGPACPFRHVEAARQNEVTCNDWRFGRCLNPACAFRHMDIPQDTRQAVPCYFETQPGGCTKPNCGFMHQFSQTSGPGGPGPRPGGPRPGAPPPTTMGVISQPPRPGGPPTSIGIVSQPPLSGPPPGWNPNTRAVGPPLQQGPPPHRGPWPGPPGMRAHGFPPPRGDLPPPPGPGLPHPYRPYQEVPMFKQHVDPVVINLNSEESDQDSVKGSSSPVKAPSRVIVPVGGATNLPPQEPPIQARSNNPLDYFLNAKPWSDPRMVKRRSASRSPSPPYRREGSLSPVRRSSPPYRRDGSLSPARRSRSPGPGRRRSISVERHNRPMDRRRSTSLDRSRSQSPDRRDRRRVRRSRSPEPRRRSRSPVRDVRDRFYRPGRGRGRDRPQNIVNRFRMDNRGPKLEEVRLAGPKIISTKKDKKEEEENQTEEGQEKEAKPSEAAKPGKPGFVEEEVKSLEDIYRERALLSMMEAKKKRIMEQKRKRWEAVKGNKKSDSQSDKSETEKESKDEEQVDEAGTEGDVETEKSAEGKAAGDDDGEEVSKEEGSSSESEEDEAEADLADDVDVEIDVGDVDSDLDADQDVEEVESDSEVQKEKTESKVPSKTSRTKSSVAKMPSQAIKPSIKSRLGLKAVEQVEQQALRDRLGSNMARARSVKERLGLRPATDSSADKPVRSGVIRLNRVGDRGNTSPSRTQVRRDDRQGRDRPGRLNDDRPGRPRTAKDILMVPQITIRNRQNLERKKTGIKQRLGLLDSDDDSSYRKKRSPMDEALWDLLQEEDVDIEESELELLSKKERRKLLKKLLTKQGREDEYEDLKRKKRRGFKRKERVEKEEEEVTERKRRINIQSRLGPSMERSQSSEDEGEELESGDEIELDVEPQEEEEDTRAASDEHKDSDSGAEEKEAEPEPQIELVPAKSAEEIRREREAKMREKELKLREALQPKSLVDIRRERAVKRGRARDGDGIELSSIQKGRRIKIARADSPEPEKPEPVVRVTFGQEDPFRKKLIRLGGGSEQNENSQPSTTSTVKPFKRERQIYVPPSSKRDGVATVSKPAEAVEKPGTDREIVDYGDMFPKKSASTGNLRKLAPIKAPELSRDKLETRQPLRLQKGPLKVEVKDATVKTFAEIMAEKKRKRLLAQQASSPDKKPFRPVVFDDSDSSQSFTTSGTNLAPDLKSRLSPTEDLAGDADKSSNIKLSEATPSIPSSSPVKSVTTVSAPSIATDNGQITNKPSRWKRRKSNPNLTADSAKPALVLPVPSGTCVEKVLESGDSDRVGGTGVTEVVSRVEVTGKGAAAATPTVAVESVPVSQKVEENTSKPSPAKKRKSSDILDLDDFESEFLDLDDDNVDLGTKDHDELLREIDELLA